jgi:hypothetical protein
MQLTQCDYNADVLDLSMDILCKIFSRQGSRFYTHLHYSDAWNVSSSIPKRTMERGRPYCARVSIRQPTARTAVEYTH